jgi:RNA polymerase sigma-70 factor, ECF subfamily
VRAITRLATEGDRVARVQNYFFNPDFVSEVCAELGLPWRSNGYRWFVQCDFAPAAAPGGGS